MNGILFLAGSPSLRQPPRTAAARREAAQEIRDLDVQEIVVGPQSPAQPLWTYQDQAQLVAWVDWLVGQDPRQSHEIYITYVWGNLPPARDIASGDVGQGRLEQAPSSKRTPRATWASRRTIVRCQ